MEIPGYRIDEVIGRGGMGVVYRAEHLHLRRTVALKVLAPEVAETAGFRERFVHEARVAAGVDHPAIVTVYDAGDVDGQLYIAMRYVEGSDLSSVLKTEGPLGAERTLAILDQVGSALDAAHAVGLVHRDVKPANVLLQGDRAYLTDFGLTKHTSAQTAFTATGQFVGTIDYVAPEQIRGQELDARADVYALGCMLFECLTGARPYRRDSEIAVIYAHLEEPPPRPSEHGLPPALDEVLARGLAKDPQQRPRRATQLLEEVRTALEEPATEVPPPAAPAPAEPTRPAAAPPTSAPPTSAPPTAAPPTSAAEPEPRTRASGPPSAPTRAIDRRRRRPLALALAGAGAVAAAVVVALLITSGGGDDDPGAAGGTDTQETSTTPPADPAAEVAARATVGAEPVGVAVRDGVAWVTNSGDGSVSRIDARSGDVLREGIPVGERPYGLTVGRGAVWVANAGDGTVSRLSSDSGEPQGDAIGVGDDPRWVALGVGGGALWVSNNGDGTVTRVDIAGGGTQAFDVGSEPRGIATTPSSVWVANAGDDSLTRIDVESGEVAQTVDAGSEPEGIAIRDGVIWVANNGDGTVTRHSNSSGEQMGDPIEVGDGPFGVWVGDDYVWVTSEHADHVTLIDPDSGEVVDGPVPVGSTPAGVRSEDGVAWVAVRDERRAVRLVPAD